MENYCDYSYHYFNFDHNNQNEKEKRRKLNKDIAKLYQSTKMKIHDKLLNTFRTCR